MDNQNNHESSINGFDRVEPATSEKPIDELFSSPEEKTSNNDETAASETSFDIEEKVESEPPQVESFTPATNYGYTPTGSYHNSPVHSPEPIYVTKKAVVKKEKKSGNKVNMNLASFIAMILIVAIVSAASGVGTFFLIDSLSNDNTPSKNIPMYNSTGSGSTITIDDSTVESVVEAVYEKASPSVVGIRTTVGVKNYFFGETQNSGEGTGIIYSSDGYIITCYHVIEKIYDSSVSSSKVEVFLPGDTENGVEATVMGYNKATDIALLKINMTGLSPAEFDTSGDLKVGQYVVAIGNPGGLQFMSSVSYGVISGLNRTVSIEGLGEMSLVQTDAAINPGNSGGALVNTSGKVIAMNSSKLVSQSYEGIGFAIPITTVMEIIQNIIENKDNPQPYLGIEYYTSVTSEWLEENNLPIGIIIKNVVSGGPAEKAGLKSGDIIVELNKVAISDVETFTDTLSKCSPGQQISIKIYRNGNYYSGNIAVGSNNNA